MGLMRTRRWVGPMSAVALVGVTAAYERGWMGATVAVAATALVILAAVAVMLQGSGRLRRLAELYLWLAMILCLYHLNVLSGTVARRAGLEELTVFQGVAVAYLVTVSVALGVIGAWSQSGGERTGRPYSIRLAARLLVFGAVVFWLGARTFPGLTLEAMAQSPGGHLWTSVGFALATLITLAGLGLLTVALREAGDRLWSVMGFATFSLGAILWLLHLTLRLTVLPLAAREFARSGLEPSWYEPWRLWAGLLFGTFSVLAYLALAAYGAAFLQTRALPRPAGWTLVVVGFLAAPVVGPPFFIHVALWVVGLLLLRPSLGAGGTTVNPAPAGRPGGRGA